MVLLICVGVAEKIFVHQGERLEYDVSKLYFYDDYEVQGVTGNISNHVSIIPKVKYIKGPPIPINTNSNSSTVLYNIDTGISFLSLFKEQKNDLLQFVKLSGFNYNAEIYNNTKSESHETFTCSSFQPILSMNNYVAFCVSNESNCWYYSCDFSSRQHPNCVINETAPCDLDPKYRYYLRTPPKYNLKNQIVFKKGYNDINSASIWTVHYYLKLTHIKEIKGYIYDITFTTNEGDSMMVTTNEGIYFVSFGHEDSPSIDISRPLKNAGGFSEFFDNYDYLNNNEGRVLEFYSASFNYSQVDKFFFNEDTGDMKKAATFNMRKRINFTRIRNSGQQLVKLKNYVALAGQNSTYHHNIIIFDTNDEQNKYAYTVIPFEKNQYIRTIQSLSPHSDILVAVVNDNVLWMIIDTHKLVFNIPETMMIGDYEVVLHLRRNGNVVAKRMEVEVLGVTDFTIKQTSKFNTFYGWAKENNTHFLQRAFLGYNISFGCSPECNASKKIQLVKHGQFTWKLYHSKRSINNTQALFYDSNTKELTLWAFDKGPKSFPLEPLKCNDKSVLPLWQIKPDIPVSVYIGNNNFTYNSNASTLYSFFYNGLSYVVSPYKFKDGTINSRYFGSSSNESILLVNSHPYNSDYYYITSGPKFKLIVITSNEKINYEHELLEYKSIDYLFLTHECTYIFYENSKISIYLDWCFKSIYNKCEVTKYKKVVGLEGMYVVFPESEYGIEFWIPNGVCESLIKEKTFYLQLNETFELDGNIISTFYLNYLMFISRIHHKGYFLNIIDFSRSQHELLYTSIPLKMNKFVEGAKIHCLRVEGRSWIIIVSEDSYEYYLFEPDPYIIVKPGSKDMKELTINVSSSYNEENIAYKLDYVTASSGKTPFGVNTPIRVESMSNQLSLPLRSYIDGFNLNYNLSIPNNVNGIIYNINKTQILSRIENPTDNILSLYKLSESIISTYKNVTNIVPQIDQYLFQNNSYDVYRLFRRENYNLLIRAIDVIPVKFKNIAALIFIEKVNRTIYKYMVMEYNSSVYELASVSTSFRAKYLAVNSDTEELILYNGDAKEVLTSKLTDKEYNQKRLFFMGDCSQSISPEAILFCPNINQLRTVSIECGVHFYSTKTVEYNPITNVSFTGFSHTISNNQSLKIQGLYGCGSEVYVVLERHGIVKFAETNTTWSYSGLIPNYDSIVLTQYGAFDNSIMAIYGYTNEYDTPQPFIRIFDLSRNVSTIPTFDLWLNETETCEKLVLHSTGVGAIYHLFYLCSSKLYHSNFTLNPLLYLSSSHFGSINFTIGGYNDFGAASANVTVVILYNPNFNELYAISITLVLIGISILMLYCWGKGEDKKVNYKKFIQELKEFNDSKFSQISLNSDNLLIQ